MELFTVNRYDPDKKQYDPEREQRVLEDLHKNIDKKKKIKKTEKHVQIEDKIVQEETHAISNAEPNDNEKIEVEKMEVDTPVTTKEPTETSENFMVLSNEHLRKKQKVDMVLPHWLAYPTIISNDLTVKGSSIENLSYLSPELKKTLKAMEINQLFPVQEAVIPWILNVHAKPMPFSPRDICVSAPTGSGKTLAYALPIVQLLMNRVERKVQALVVLPVNELAVQVLKVFKKLCENTRLTCGLLTKFVPFATEQAHLVEQFNGKYYSKVDIVIATTGRLVEHIHSTKGFCLKSLKFLVMDEADRIMEQIHNNWLYHLDAHVKEESDMFLSGRLVPLCYSALCAEASKKPHKLLFSATLSQDPEKLQNLRLFQPKLFTAIVKEFNLSIIDIGEKPSDMRGDFIGKFTTPAELTEKYCLTQPELKPLTLYTLIMENKWNRFLCFTNSGEAAHRLSFVLQFLLGSDMQIEELSSGLSANVRNAVLLKFQNAKIHGLICSDALARGMDIKGVDIVISYDAPRHIKTYIHRIGRTARAGKQGLAVTILTTPEIKSFNNLIISGGKSELMELPITSNTEELKAKNYAAAVEALKNALKREEQLKIMKAVNEKQKSNTNNKGFMGQLQSQIQKSDVGYEYKRNIPESWKWENQQNVNARKERKNKRKKNVKKTVENSVT